MSGSLKNVFIFLRQFFITVFHVIMIICISLYHDHKIILNFESCKIKFTIRHSIVMWIRHSIVTRIRHFIVTKRLWKSSIAIYQMSKFTRSDDVCLFFQITKSPPFYSMHIHCIKFTVLIPAFFPVSHQLNESRLLPQKNRSFRSLTTL